MNLHTFDPEVAQIAGVVPAVIYQNIKFWIWKNAASDENCFEGKVWTYNSIRAFGLLFPYLTEKQIRTALDHLEELGLIGTGNFNKSAYDRTKWFCLLRQIDLPIWANGIGQKGEPIPDSKPVIKPDSNTASLFGADAPLPVSKQKPQDTEQVFEQFWNAYPNKKEKKGARAKFDAAVKSGVDPAKIVAAAKSYAVSDQVKRGFAKHPTTWLHNGCWDDEGVSAPVAPVHVPLDQAAPWDRLRREAGIFRGLGDYDKADRMEARAAQLEAGAV